MTKKEYTSPEYHAQGLRDALKSLKGYNFSPVRQSKGIVTFTFSGSKYSIEFKAGRANKPSALLEQLATEQNSNGGKSWREVGTYSPQLKRSKTGRIPEQVYAEFFKKHVLPSLIKPT
ncbi:hypothetical protein CMI37_38120 [Candidatus Pacearchaeota archaeon]|nr:hypothetical protein [Candidatus Pacearchaeota archaeon]|tara:strand:- start:2402 stop:2755 length:354 start_codon:yes stop_codon:yes gene_type:complete